MAAAEQVTEDALLGGRLRLRQPAEGFRAAIDPVLLAAAADASDGDRALDLGCGLGTAGLALALRVPGVRVTGVDIDPAMVALARDNAGLNGLAARVEALEGDVRSHGFADHDLVLCNPPFLEPEAGTRSGHAGRDRAMKEGEAQLDDWVRAALSALRPQGQAVFIHRADRLDALLGRLSGPAGAIEIFPLWPSVEPRRPAKRVIVRARKGRRSPTRLLPGLVLHRAGGGYSAAAEAVLRGLEPLPF